ncbi:MAG: hypothetical protein HY072_04460 [Deltaproteobacteria bacterium]|nr:hypothetical protein [Deltaproteobacteria bacterium]
MRALITVLIFLQMPSLFAAINPEKVYQVETKKSEVYVHEGLFVGGDRAVQDVVVKDIRCAMNAGFERLVLDLEKNTQDDNKQLERPPYFQVSMLPLKKQLVFTLWGKPKLAFSAPKVIAAFKKSKWVNNLELYPYLEENKWTFVVNLKTGKKLIEVFELSNPMRIIVDIR